VGSVQTKLSVGAPNDEYEQEADAVADKVMRMPAQTVGGGTEDPPSIQSKSATMPSVQRLCAGCEEEQAQGGNMTLQKKPAQSTNTSPVSASVSSIVSSPGAGSPLGESVRSRIEPALGADLSSVRVHSGTPVEDASKNLNARAFTNRNNIFLGRGESPSDLQLMAHEATHVVQQGSHGLIQRACPTSDTAAFDQRANECRAHAAYLALSPESRAIADDIITQARSSDRCLYFIGKLKLLLDTPDAPPAETAAESRTEVDEAVAEEAERLAEPENVANTGQEESVSGHPIRSWVEREGEGGTVFHVDRGDPNNIVVRMRVNLHPEGSGTADDVSNTQSLEDGIEKHASTRGYTLDIIFVERTGRDVFSVGVNPDEWTTSGNWVGDVGSIAHEAHHLLGLDDRYDYIESHAGNEDLAIGDRLYWFREQMSRPHDPEGADSMMNDSNLSLLDDDVCNVAGLDVDDCVAARQAGTDRAAGVTIGEDPTLTYQGLCIKSVFGGEITFSGLSTDVLSDIAVINEGPGLVMRPVNNVAYDCDGFWYRFRSDWFKVPDHCGVNVSASPANPRFYSQCCNLAAGVFYDDPHWSTNSLAAGKRNPFGVTE